METVSCLGDVTKVQIIFKRNHRFSIVYHGLPLETIAQKRSLDMDLVRNEVFGL